MTSSLLHCFRVALIVTLHVSTVAAEVSSFILTKDKNKRFLKKPKLKREKVSKKAKKEQGSKHICDEFSTVSSLDLERYSGRWYQIYATDSPNVIKRCGAANYVYNPPNPNFGAPPTVDIVNTGFCSPGEQCPPPYGQVFSINGNGLPNPGFKDEAGKFLVTLLTGFGSQFTFNYWVIDVVSDPTDETAPYLFAAVTDPFYPGGALTYLLSREPNPTDDDTIVGLLAKLESVGIPLDNIVPTEQEISCVYE